MKRTFGLLLAAAMLCGEEVAVGQFHKTKVLYEALVDDDNATIAEVKTLISQGADVNERVGKTTPFLKASYISLNSAIAEYNKGRYFEIVKVMIANGANVNYQNWPEPGVGKVNGRTPMDWTVPSKMAFDKEKMKKGSQFMSVIFTMLEEKKRERTSK